MKENTIGKIFNPFKEILTNDLVSKAKTGFNDLVSGVKNMFRSSEEEQVTLDINNCLKTPQEIDAELHFIYAATNEPATQLEETVTVVVNAERYMAPSRQPSNFRPLEEALQTEMEENY